MEHKYSENPSDVVVLIKESSHIPEGIRVDYLQKLGTENATSFPLAYGGKKAPNKAIMQDCLNEIVPLIQKCAPKIVLCCDPNYFKVLTGLRNSKGYSSVIVDSIHGFKVMLVPNYQSVFHNPANESIIDMCLREVGAFLFGKSTRKDVLTTALYLKNPDKIKQALDSLSFYSELVVDIETFGLIFYDCGIGTIAFSYDQHSAIGMVVDWDGETRTNNIEVKNLLFDFFVKNAGKIKLIGHNLGFDFKVLIYELFMKQELTNIEGMYFGLDTLFSNYDDTKIITYLATNNAVENVLGLKDNVIEFAGNYAVDVKDITKVPVKDLLKYNQEDCCSTFWLYKRNFKKMLEDAQDVPYNRVFKPMIPIICEMELVGAPIDMQRVFGVKQILEDKLATNTKYINEHPEVIEFTTNRRITLAINATKKLKKKVKTAEDFAHITFNPASSDQLTALLYDQLNYPCTRYTKSGAKSADGKALKVMRNNLLHVEHADLLESLLDTSSILILLDNFVSNFIKYSVNHGETDGWRLHGSFNLGGTKSGRLSSSEPNMQNIPSGSNNPYAKLIKSCFISTTNWVFCGADFASLEDKISALTTRDPNKLAVYLDGYDGHCLRAHSYFSAQMPDIVIPTEPEKHEYFEVLFSSGKKYMLGSDLLEFPDRTVTVKEYVQGL